MPVNFFTKKIKKDTNTPVAEEKSLKYLKKCVLIATLKNKKCVIYSLSTIKIMAFCERKAYNRMKKTKEKVTANGRGNE